MGNYISAPLLLTAEIEQRFAQSKWCLYIYDERWCTTSSANKLANDTKHVLVTRGAFLSIWAKIASSL